MLKAVVWLPVLKKRNKATEQICFTVEERAWMTVVGLV